MSIHFERRPALLSGVARFSASLIPPLAAMSLWAAQPVFAGDLAGAVGPLAGEITLGQNGAWQSSEDNGAFILEDSQKSGAVRYYDLPWQGDDQKGRSVGVSVDVSGNGTAGLIMRRLPDKPGWVALVVRQDGHAIVYDRSADALTTASDVVLPASNGSRLVQVSSRDGKLLLLVDGRQIATIDPAPRGEGQVGIVGIGPGRFAFRNFAFGPYVEASAQGGDDQVPTTAGGGDDQVPGSTPEKPKIDELTSNVIGAMFGIVAHEFGHFMIGELHVPSTGPEEDVADEFSAMVYVDNLRSDKDTVFPFAFGSAAFWWYVGQDEGQDNQPPWYDEHAPNLRRFSSYACMLYGEFPDLFQPLMDQTKIPDRTQDRCKTDAPKRHEAWTALLQPHRRKGIDPLFPGDLPHDAPGHTVTVEYQPSATEVGNKIETIFKQFKLLDNIADSVNKLYVLPRDTKIVMRDCKQENAFYNPVDGSVTVCTEMVNAVVTTFKKHQGNGQEGGDTTAGGPNDTPTTPPPNTDPTVPHPTPPAGNPNDSGMTIGQYLEGVWRSNESTPAGPGVMLTQFSQDGAYRVKETVSTAFGPFVVNIMGHWTAKTDGNKNFEMTLEPQKWSPKKFCPAQNYCTPLTYSAMTAQFVIVDHDTLKSGGSTATRVQ